MTTTISRRTEQIPIYQGDDAAAIALAQEKFNRAVTARSLAEVAESTPRRMGDSTPLMEATEAVQAAAEEYDAAIAAALPRAVKVTIQAVGRKTYRRLLSENPPRDGNEGDAEMGFDRDAFGVALLEHFDGETGERSIIAPEFGSKNDLVAWLDDLSEGNSSDLESGAIRVNIGGSPNPKASLASQVEQMYGATSPSPASTA